MASSTDHAGGRRRVLDAAASLFVEQGYAATTLRQIASAVGIKAGSIYHHFESKDALFAQILEEGIDVMVDAFDKADAASSSGSQQARLLAHVRAHLGALFEHGHYTAAHVTAFFTAPPSVRANLVEPRDRYEAKWSALLAELVPNLDDQARRTHRLLLFGAMNTTIEWFDPSGTRDGGSDLDDLAAAIVRQFLKGVAR